MIAHRRIVRIGDPAPEFGLPSSEGEIIYLADYRGKRTLIFIWAPWEFCRDQLSGWEAFYQKHSQERFELISLAVDADGASRVRPFLDAARPSFKTMIDVTGASWALYGFELIPSGYYIDESGHVRYLKVGGFDVHDNTTVKIVEDLLAEKWGKKPVKPVERPYTSIRQEIVQLERQLKTSSRSTDKRLRFADLMMETGHLRKAAREYDAVLAQHPKHVKALFGRGVSSMKEGKLEPALAYWHKALALAPTNWIIRKQIWALEHPEQFYPAINYPWQQEQLRLEEFLASTQQKAKAQRR
jgi:peroxiredoxin